MSDQPVDMKTGAPGDPMFDACFRVMDLMREATAAFVEQQPDPRDGLTIVMTAAAIFAGVQAGTLMAMGELRQQDRRRLGEAALHNFRQGIDFGLNRGLRIATEEGGGSA